MNFKGKQNYLQNLRCHNWQQYPRVTKDDQQISLLVNCSLTQYIACRHHQHFRKNNINRN